MVPGNVDNEAAPAGDGVETVIAELRARLAACERTIAEQDRRLQGTTETEATFRGLLESAPDAIVIVGEDGRIAIVNRQTETLFGYQREELLGAPIEILIPERFHTAHLTHRAGYVAAPRTRPMGAGLALHARRRDGSEFPVEISLSPLRLPGELLVTAVIRDITERARAAAILEEQKAELARSNAELEQFAYVASHDLQEPLRMVASYTQLLARRYRGKLDADADEFIAYAVDGATRMRELIDDLLSYSRVGTRGKPFAPVALDAVLDRALGNLGAALTESGAEVTHAPLPAVIGDEVQLGQLFLNLLGNAIKFRRAGVAPRVAIDAVREGDFWRFAVRDNGIGIAPEYTDRVFAIFQRLHTRTDYPGTGIGLAICKKIVERHGGRIWFDPVPDGGTAFGFTLPAAPAESEAV